MNKNTYYNKPNYDKKYNLKNYFISTKTDKLKLYQ